MGAKWLRKWEGGRVREVDGREVFVIERRVGGRRHVVTLDVTSEREARAEYALWSRDPDNYRTRSASTATDRRAVVDDATVAGLLAHLGREGQSVEHRKAVRGYLAKWGEALKGRDLRKVELRDLHAALDGWPTARKYRIISLKTFTSWLRETGRLKPHEDPTLALKVPPSVAEKGTTEKGYDMRTVERFYRQLNSQTARDVVCLRAKTGMHGTEIDRLAVGKGRLIRIDDPSGIAGTVTFPHKNGRLHVVSLDEQAFSAAERLQARGRSLHNHSLQAGLDRAAKRLGVAPIVPSELRHSFATWSGQVGRLVKPKKGGVPIEMVAGVMGHHTARTTKMYYDGTRVPAMIWLPLRLEHPEDPAPIGAGAAVAETKAARIIQLREANARSGSKESRSTSTNRGPGRASR